MKVPFKQIPSGEKSDCVVATFSACLNKPYQEVYQWLSELGRHSFQGVQDDLIKEILMAKSFKLLPTLYRMKLEELVPHCHTGIYFCLVPRHAFCIIDGVVHDCLTSPTKSRVERVYRYDLHQKTNTHVGS